MVLDTGFGMPAWTTVNGEGPRVGNNVIDWSQPGLYIDLTTSLERAGFHYLLFEDTSMIEDGYGGSSEVSLRRGFFAPKNDPMPLVPILTRVPSRHATPRRGTRSQPRRREDPGLANSDHRGQ
jgi:hypothetical protein